MRNPFDLSVVVTTFERPRHLIRSLTSLAVQRGVEGRFEVIVADDGSRDDTEQAVRRFAQDASFPVKWTTQRHEGYRVAKCRNGAARESQGRYLLFTDGDCIFPDDHLLTHLRVQRPGVVWVGDCFRFDEAKSEAIDEKVIAAGAFRDMVPQQERLRIRRLRWKSQIYEWLRHKQKPKLVACNCSLLREDFELVNGFDEAFVGWGCEDDDLGLRLRGAGFRFRTMLGKTQPYHLWHPLDPTHPGVWQQGSNVERLCDAQRPIRARQGLVHDSPDGVPEESAATDQQHRLDIKSHQDAA